MTEFTPSFSAPLVVRFPVRVKSVCWIPGPRRGGEACQREACPILNRGLCSQHKAIRWVTIATSGSLAEGVGAAC
jgi:hypothetical protein